MIMSRSMQWTLVLLALAILAALMYSAAKGNACGNADYVEAKTMVRSIADGSVAFQAECGYWPRNQQDLLKNERRIAFVVLRKGSEWTDPWGHPILYVPYDQERGYGYVLSYGRDGKPGGVALNGDIEMRFGK